VLVPLTDDGSRLMYTDINVDPTPTRLSRGVSFHWGGGHFSVQRFGLLTYR
jgi:hypothetical protein